MRRGPSTVRGVCIRRHSALPEDDAEATAVAKIRVCCHRSSMKPEPSPGSLQYGRAALRSCWGGVGIETLIKTSLIHSVSHFNLGAWCLLGGGLSPPKHTPAVTGLDEIAMFGNENRVHLHTTVWF